MVLLQILWRQVLPYVPLSADHVLVPAMCLATKDSASVIRHVTSRTVKVLRLQTDRLLPLLLWMPVLSQQPPQTKDILRQQLTWMSTLQNRNISLIKRFMKIVYTMVSEKPIHRLRSNLVQTS